MSGSDESDDELVSGSVNRANDRTIIWAENKYNSVLIGPNPPRTDFNGDAIFYVEVAGDPEDDGEFRPSQSLDAIVGNGWSAEYAGGSGGTGVTGNGGKVGGLGVLGQGGENGKGVLGDAGGRATGVVGLGGPLEGTGVFGLGSGGDRPGPDPDNFGRHGAGGIGVRGEGGRADLQPGRSPVLPGAGVFGQGGKIPDTNTGRLLLGAGVIGVGGGAGDKDLPSVNETGSVGVFGQGADAEVRRIVDGGGATLVGPAEPGAGVIGRGGVGMGPEAPPPAAGVIGLAGGQTKPPITITGDVGVFGLGPTGVRGSGDGGPGIRGHSDNDRGGVFESVRSAQVRLVPQELRARIPSQVTVTPTEIPAGSGPALPKDGRGGDLMVIEMETEDKQQVCTLWFCVQSGRSAGPARWAQVLVGSSFDGQ